MHTMKIDNGGFLYPKEVDSADGSVNLFNSKYKLAGYGGTVATYGVPIPLRDSYKDFVSSMNEIEKNISLSF